MTPADIMIVMARQHDEHADCLTRLPESVSRDYGHPPGRDAIRAHGHRVAAAALRAEAAKPEHQQPNDTQGEDR